MLHHLLALCISTLCMLAPSLHAAESTPAVQDKNAPVEALVKKLKACLPEWEIVGSGDRQTPPGWVSNQREAGITICCEKKKNTVWLYFLPRDWIGIYLFDSKTSSSFFTLSAQFLIGDEYKMIATVPDNSAGFLGSAEAYKFSQALYGKLGTTISLANSGESVADEIFGKKLEATDRAASELIRKYCSTPEQFNAAALSLVVTGVPARSVYLRAAKEADAKHRDLYFGIIGRYGMHLFFDEQAEGFTTGKLVPNEGTGGDPEAIAVLCDIVANEQLPSHERGRAAIALEGHIDKRIGSALINALPSIDDDESIMKFAKVLAEQQNLAVGPALLNAFKRMSSDSYRVDMAELLASIKCTDAIPEIRKLATAVTKSDPRARYPDRVARALATLEGNEAPPAPRP